MPKRKRPFKDPDDQKLREDAAETAYRVLQEAIGERPKSLPPEKRGEKKDPEAQRRGRAGGKKGGKARAEKLTPEQRAEVARIAARVRWKRDR